MRLGPKIITFAALALAAALSWFAATFAAEIVKTRSEQAVRMALIEADHEWATVHTDGLQVHVGGTAPSEAARFNALSVSAGMVEASRVIDGTTVVPAQPIEPPRFSVEILRNDEGVSLIGLVPGDLDREAMAAEIAALAQGAEVTDFLETADYPIPGGWVPAFNFALDALARLPRAKISATAGEVSITAISGSPEEKRQLELLLRRIAPSAISVTIDISAPRPVITPFTLRFLRDERGARFDACSADSERDRERILAAAYLAGMEPPGTCTLGLGVPTSEWANAVVMAIAAVHELDGGSLTFSDADVALVAPVSTDEVLFDRVVGGLESNLPDVFSLKAVLPEPPRDEVDGAGPPPPEFTATRDTDGAVELRGRLPSETVHGTVESFARARFGVDAVYMAARTEAAGLPEDWPVRVLAGLSALSEVDHGAVTVLEASLSLNGVSGNAQASSEIARILTDKLGSDADITLDVSYDERLDPLADLPTPEECIGRIDLILSETKITFAPSSTEIEGDSVAVVDAIAEVLRDCRNVLMEIEIGGHTDSQGREQMNLDLSQARAAAVLDALAERRVRTDRIRARGFGEDAPIADNGTQSGREANRRIEFLLVGPIADAALGVDGATAPTATGPTAADEAASDEAASDEATSDEAEAVAPEEAEAASATEAETSGSGTTDAQTPDAETTDAETTDDPGDE